MLIGYARVSTDDQNLNLQKDALTRAGCERILEDRQSGAKADRAGLRDALDYARDGDTLTVWRLDRLSRSLKLPPRAGYPQWIDPGLGRSGAAHFGAVLRKRSFQRRRRIIVRSSKGLWSWQN